MAGHGVELADCQGVSLQAQLGHHVEGRSRQVIELRLIDCRAAMQVFGGEWKPWTMVRSCSFNDDIENDAMSYIVTNTHAITASY